MIRMGKKKDPSDDQKPEEIKEQEMLDESEEEQNTLFLGKRKREEVEEVEETNKSHEFSDEIQSIFTQMRTINALTKTPNLESREDLKPLLTYIKSQAIKADNESERYWSESDFRAYFQKIAQHFQVTVQKLQSVEVNSAEYNRTLAIFYNSFKSFGDEGALSLAYTVAAIKRIPAEQRTPYDKHILATANLTQFYNSFDDKNKDRFLSEAIDIINSIPDDKRTTEDKRKLAIAYFEKVTPKNGNMKDNYTYYKKTFEAFNSIPVHDLVRDQHLFIKDGDGNYSDFSYIIGLVGDFWYSNALEDGNVDQMIAAYKEMLEFLGRIPKRLKQSIESSSMDLTIDDPYIVFDPDDLEAEKEDTFDRKDYEKDEKRIKAKLTQLTADKNNLERIVNALKNKVFVAEKEKYEEKKALLEKIIANLGGDNSNLSLEENFISPYNDIKKTITRWQIRNEFSDELKLIDLWKIDQERYEYKHLFSAIKKKISMEVKEIFSKRIENRERLIENLIQKKNESNKEKEAKIDALTEEIISLRQENEAIKEANTASSHPSESTSSATRSQLGKPGFFGANMPPKHDSLAESHSPIKDDSVSLKPGRKSSS